MKKLTVCVAVLLALCTAICCVSVGCNKNEPDLTGITAAKEYLSGQLRDAATVTNADFTRPAALRNEHGSYTVAWTVSVTSGDANGVKVGDAVNGIVTIDVDSFATAEIVYTLTATITDAEGNTETLTFNHKVEKFNAITVAEFLAKEEGDTIYAIIGYVMATGANEGSTGSFVVGDETGAIFSYETKREVFVGDKIAIWGKRSSNYQLPQITNTDVQILESNSASYAEDTATTLAAEDIDLAADNATVAAMAGKYYKITGSTLVMSDGYTNANYNDAQLLKLYTNDEIVGAVADFYGEPVDIYGYVRGNSPGNYLTIQVTKIEWAGEGTFVPSTPETRVAYEKENLTVDKITVEGEVELPTKGSRYFDTEISWALASTTVATLTDNVLTVAALPEADTDIVLTATIKNGTVTDTKEITVKVCAPAETFIKKALTAGAALADKAQTSENYIIIGTVSKITSAYSDQYENVSFNVTDGTNEILVYRYNLEDAATIKVGDAVAFAAPIKKYGTDIEAVATFLPLELTSIKDANTLGLAGTGEDGTMVYGSIKSIDSAYSSSYDNITITITDGTNDLYCYRLKGGADLEVGMYVLITGKPSSYKNAAQMAQGATYTLGTYEAPAVVETVTTIEAALSAAIDTPATLSGTVKSISEAWNTQYSNMSYYLTDGTNQILVYHAGGAEVKVGDVVSVTGKIGEYSSKKQLVSGTTTITTAHVCANFTEADCENPAKCTVCGTVQTGSVALGHTDVNPADNTCDRCSANLALNEESFAIAANAGVLAGDSLSLSWASTNFNFVAEKGTNNNAIRVSDSDHFRVYQGNNFKISGKASQGIAKVVITCTSNDYATACVNSLTSAGAIASADGTVVTVTVTAGTLAEITFTAAAQFRINNIVVFYA